ncbi:phasin family protein [Roseibium aestuarii]|uniref:Phasin family protein n=1 Tax=Roseibium aestuarii TaxID=2600299 RepID=A0ABW4JXI6_9HYPH|nr:phasin family protein [Roseibium aestuarii]
MLNNFEGIQKMGKDNMDIAMESLSAMTKGVQAIAAEMADYQKKSFEEGSAVVEKMVASKSLETAFETQTEYFKSAYEGMMSEMTKLGEMYTELSKDAYKPFEAMMAKAGK